MIAIDLAAKPHRPTGLAWWDGRSIQTTTVRSDEEILKAALEHAIVGIDAPLSEPAEGSLRACDRMLRQARVRFFPVTLPSMRALGKRGQRLADEIRASGIKVYEIYPGASLDFLGLPRKQVSAVANFLSVFGPRPRNIHESDAAIGVFSLMLLKAGHGRLLKGEDGAIVVSPPAIPIGEVVTGEFVRRLNRFVVEVRIKGRTTTAYLRNTGDLSDVLSPGTRLLLNPHNGKHPYLLRATENTWIDSFEDNRMAALFLRQRGVIAKSGRRYGNHIFDLETPAGPVEVKGASYGNAFPLFPRPCSARAVRQIAAGRLKELIFIAHQPAVAVGLNPACADLAEVLSAATRRGLEIRAYSTVVWRGFWIGEMEVPFLW